MQRPVGNGAAQSAERRARSAERGAQSAERQALCAPRSALRAARCGFTLLEMILATFICVLLMGALYVAVDVQLRHAQAGRDAIERDTLARALFARMTNEIKACVTPVAPTPRPSLSSSSPSTSTPAAGSSTTPSTSPSSSTPSASSPTSAASTLLPLRDTIQFTLGVQGTATTLTLYVSRLPSELDESRAEVVSDLRLISYWLATDGMTPIGLARREFKRVTADEANGSPAASGNPEEGPAIIADEVKSLQFRYFDGTDWYDTWDGTETGWDGVTPIGPPMLIEITLGMVVPTGDVYSRGQPSLKPYRHVVSIATADGVMQ